MLKNVVSLRGSPNSLTRKNHSDIRDTPENLGDALEYILDECWIQAKKQLVTLVVTKVGVV